MWEVGADRDRSVGGKGDLCNILIIKLNLKKKTGKSSKLVKKKKKYF